MLLLKTFVRRFLIDDRVVEFVVEVAGAVVCSCFSFVVFAQYGFTSFKYNLQLSCLFPFFE